MQKAEDMEEATYAGLLKRYGCSLCNEVFINTFTTNCHHKFCRRCILKWLRYCRKCPECISIVSKISPMKRIDAEIERIYQTLPTPYRKHRDELKKKRFRAELEWKRMKIVQDVLSASHLDRMKAAEGMRQKIKDSRTTSRKFRPPQHTNPQQYQQLQQQQNNGNESLTLPSIQNNNNNNNNNNINTLASATIKHIGNRKSTKKKKSTNHNSNNNNNYYNSQTNNNTAKVEFLKLPALDYGQQESTQISVSSSLVKNHAYASIEDIKIVIPAIVVDGYQKPIVNFNSMERPPQYQYYQQQQQQQQPPQLEDQSKIVQRHYIGPYARKLDNGYDSPESSFATCSSPILSIKDSPGQVPHQQQQQQQIPPQLLQPLSPYNQNQQPLPPIYNNASYDPVIQMQMQMSIPQKYESKTNNTFSTLKEKERADIKRRLRSDNVDEVDEFLKNCPVERIWENDLFSFLKVHGDSSEDAENYGPGKMPYKENNNMKKKRKEMGSREKEVKDYQQHQISKDQQIVQNFYQEIDRRRFLYDSLKGGVNGNGTSYNNNNNYNSTTKNGTRPNTTIAHNKIPPSKLKQMAILTKFFNKVPEAHDGKKINLNANNPYNYSNEINNVNETNRKGGGNRKHGVGNSYSKPKQIGNPNPRIFRGNLNNNDRTIRGSTAPTDNYVPNNNTNNNSNIRSKFGNSTNTKHPPQPPIAKNIHNPQSTESSGNDLIIQKITAELLPINNQVFTSIIHEEPQEIREIRPNEYEHIGEKSRRQQQQQQQQQQKQHLQSKLSDLIDDSGGGGIPPARRRNAGQQNNEENSSHSKAVENKDSLEELLAKFRAERHSVSRSDGKENNHNHGNNYNANPPPTTTKSDQNIYAGDQCYQGRINDDYNNKTCCGGPVTVVEGETGRGRCSTFRDFENGFLQQIRQKYPITNPRKSASEIAATIQALSPVDLTKYGGKPKTQHNDNESVDNEKLERQQYDTSSSKKPSNVYPRKTEQIADSSTNRQMRNPMQGNVNVGNKRFSKFIENKNGPSTNILPEKNSSGYRKYSRLNNEPTSFSKKSNEPENDTMQHYPDKIPENRKSRKTFPNPPPTAASTAKKRHFTDDDDTKSAAKHGMIRMSSRNRKIVPKSLHTSDSDSYMSTEENNKVDSHKKADDKQRNLDANDSDHSERRKNKKDGESKGVLKAKNSRLNEKRAQHLSEKTLENTVANNDVENYRSNHSYSRSEDRERIIEKGRESSMKSRSNADSSKSSSRRNYQQRYSNINHQVDIIDPPSSAIQRHIIDVD